MSRNSAAYQAGLNNQPYYTTTSKEYDDYVQGKEDHKIAVETTARVGEGMHALISLIMMVMRPIMKFIVLYSGFILLAISTTVLIPLSLGIVLDKGAALFIILSLAYCYFCGFEYFRAQMIHKRRYNLSWRLFFLFGLTMRLFIPIITMAVIIRAFYGDQRMPGFIDLFDFSKPIWLIYFIALMLAISIGRIYKHMNLFSEESTPLIAKWAFDYGKQKAAARFRAEIPYRDLRDSRKAGLCYITALYCCSITIGTSAIYLLYLMPIAGMPIRDLPNLIGYFSFAFVPFIFISMLLVDHFALILYNYRYRDSKTRSMFTRLLVFIGPIIILLANTFLFRMDGLANVSSAMMLIAAFLAPLILAGLLPYLKKRLA